MDDEFEKVWKAYPRKIGKQAAMQAWKKAKDKPPLVDILQAIEKAKQSEQWTKENGQFIPHPSTWLNQGRWADEVQPKRKSLMEEFIERGTHGHGSRTVLQRVAATHYATVGAAVSGPDASDGGAASDSADPARTVL
jgi:hypothetical protein